MHKNLSVCLSLSIYRCVGTCFPGIHVPLPFRRKEPVVDVSEDEEDEDENFWDKESFWQMTVFVVPAYKGGMHECTEHGFSCGCVTNTDKIGMWIPEQLERRS